MVGADVGASVGAVGSRVGLVGVAVGAIVGHTRASTKRHESPPPLQTLVLEAHSASTQQFFRWILPYRPSVEFGVKLYRYDL